MNTIFYGGGDFSFVKTLKFSHNKIFAILKCFKNEILITVTEMKYNKNISLFYHFY